MMKSEGLALGFAQWRSFRIAMRGSTCTLSLMCPEVLKIEPCITCSRRGENQAIRVRVFVTSSRALCLFHVPQDLP